MAHKRRYIYAPERVRGDYGYWVCTTCGIEFCGGAGALHKPGCADANSGYTPCDYYFGDSEVAKAKETARIWNDERQRTPLGPLSVAILRRHYRHLLKDAPA